MDRFSPDVIMGHDPDEEIEERIRSAKLANVTKEMAELDGARPLPESYAFSALGIALRLKRKSNRWKVWNRASCLEGRRSI
jgi:hypothetical protein